MVILNLDEIKDISDFVLEQCWHDMLKVLNQLEIETTCRVMPTDETDIHD